MPGRNAGERYPVRWPLVVLLALALGAGTRDRPAAAAPPGGDQRPPLDASLVLPLDNPADKGVFALHAGELLASPEMAPLVAQLNDFCAHKLKGTMLPFNLPIDVRDVEQVSGRILLKVADGSPHGSLILGLTAIRM